MTESPSRWLWANSVDSRRVIVLSATLFGLALISRSRVLWAWKTAPGLDDFVGLTSELVVALLVAFVLWRLNNMICTFVAAYWSLMCLVDGESLFAMQTVASLENAGYFFDGDFLMMTFSSASASHLVATFVFLLLPAVFVLVVLRYLDSRSVTKPEPRRWMVLAIPALLVVLLLLMGLAVGDGGGWRQKSFALVHLEQLAEMASGSTDPGTLQVLPSDREVVSFDLSGERGEVGAARNVLLVILEGIPGVYVDQVAQYFDVRQPISMTGLSRIAERSLVVPNFLTHKQQTIRGLYSVLCADYPKLGGGTPKALEMLSGSNQKPDCLPSVLASHGYRTAFIQAAPLEYMSKSTVMPFIGFGEVRGKESFEMSDGPRRGWGPRDREFFRQVVPMLEKLDQEGDPWFATLLTVGTHHPYFATEREVEKYGSEKNAAVMAADEAVSELFAELVASGLAEDTLIIITSDESHGVWPHPHGNAWGVMLVHGPDIEPGFNTEVFGSVDTSVSVLDYLGIDPRPRMNGRSVFRRYCDNRTMLFAVGRDIAMTEEKGVFHLCKPRRLGSFAGESQGLECVTRFTDSGEMFAEDYGQGPRDGHLATYQELFRLKSLLDSNVAFKSVSSRLVFVEDVVAPVRDHEDYWLLGGQFFEIPSGSAARISLRVRYQSDGEQLLRLQHHWMARVRTEGGTRDVRIADFVVPAVQPGGGLRLEFLVGDLGGLSQVEANVQGRSGVGSVVVDEYSVEFFDDPDGEVASFELVDARLKYPRFREERLEEFTRSDGQRQVLTIPVYRTGQKVSLTDRDEHHAYTMLDGWWRTEEWTTWSRDRAHIYINLEEVKKDQLFTIEMASYLQSVSDDRPVELLVNGRHVVTWSVASVESGFRVYETLISANRLHEGVNTLVIHPVGELTSPYELGRSGDKRKIGVGVRSFSMSPTGY